MFIFCKKLLKFGNSRRWHSFIPAGPWLLNLSISLLFMIIFMFLIVRTNFALLIYYDISILVLILTSICFMCTFLLQMRGGLPKLPKQLVIPHPTYICLLALTICVSIGYCYIFVLKLALFGCDKAVEARDLPHLLLDSAQRLAIAIFAVISFVYIIQRAHIGSLNSSLDIFTRNFTNCVFGILWIRFLLLKGYFTIEQFCRDDLNVTSIVKDFCPPYIKNGFQCKSEDLRPEQLIWNRLHYGLLKSTVVTSASEFFPVLLVAHWLACGKAEKVMRKLTTKMNNQSNCKIEFALKMANADANAVGDSGSICSATLMMSSILVRRTLRLMAFTFGLMGICLWLLSFFNYIHDLHHSKFTDAQDGMEVFTSIIRFAFFAILFLWVKKVPNRELDLHHRAESRGDRVLIFCSLAFLSLETIFDISELLIFSAGGKRSKIVIKFMDIIVDIFSLGAKWLEAFSLRKIIALKRDYLLQFGGILPFIVFGCIIFNFADFSMTYFYIEDQKHHLTEIIESLEHNDAFVLIGVAGRILFTANYLYTFTSALIWIDVLMRYHHSGFFVLGKSKNTSNEMNTTKMRMEEGENENLDYDSDF